MAVLVAGLRHDLVVTFIDQFLATASNKTLAVTIECVDVVIFAEIPVNEPLALCTDRRKRRVCGKIPATLFRLGKILLDALVICVKGFTNINIFIFTGQNIAK